MPEVSAAAPTSRVPAHVWVLALLLFYFAAIAVAAAQLAPSGRSDDLETLLLSQSLAWGYEAKNPPAFYWLAYAATQAFGGSVAVIGALRLAGVFLMVAGLYALARRLQPDPLLAACAGLGVLATLHFHWYLLFHLTNSALALALTPAAVLALLRLRARPTGPAYALVGLVIGVGLLSRYNYAIFAAALAGAALLTPAWRRLVLAPRLLIALTVIGLLFAPHLVWVARHAPLMSAQLEAQLIGTPAPYLERLVEGFTNLVESAVSIVVFPLGLLVLACFPRALRPLAVADPDRAAGLGLIGRTLAIGLGLMLVYVVLTGSPYVKPHHLFFLVLLPVWLIARLDAATLGRWRAPAFAAALAGCVAAAAVAFRIENRADAAGCAPCAEFQPLDTYAAALRAAGFRAGTVVALSTRQEFPTAALRAAFPEARFVAIDYPLYAPPAGGGGDCLIVWNPATTPPPERAGAPVPRIGQPLPSDAVLGTVAGELHLADRPADGMGFALVAGGLGSCR